MKSMMIALVLSFGAFAQEAPEKGFIQTTFASPCSSWGMLRDAQGRIGYGCMLYPRMVTIADGNDVIREIDDLNRRVEELEEKLEVALEALANK
jgi:formate-dependent phosphoribosylglycinamide formyltransferase (GAR transformylase)